MPILSGLTNMKDNPKTGLQWRLWARPFVAFRSSGLWTCVPQIQLFAYTGEEFELWSVTWNRPTVTGNEDESMSSLALADC